MIWQIEKSKQWSVVTTLMISLVMVTPLCGFLFKCGCDWPGLGLDTHCNFYKASVVHQCPWCVSMVMGVFSVGTAVIAGMCVSFISIDLFTTQSFIKELFIRVLCGIIVFVLVASMAAKIAALWQGYPL